MRAAPTSDRQMIHRLGQAQVSAGMPVRDLPSLGAENRSAVTQVINGAQQFGLSLVETLVQKLRSEGFVVRDRPAGGQIEVLARTGGPPKPGEMSFGDYLARQIAQTSPKLSVASVEAVTAYLSGAPVDLVVFVASGASKEPTYQQVLGSQTQFAVLGPRGGIMPYPASYPQFSTEDWQARLAVYNSQRGASGGTKLTPENYGAPFTRDFSGKWDLHDSKDRTSQAFFSFADQAGVRDAADAEFAKGTNEGIDAGYALVYKKLVDVSQPIVGDPSALASFVESINSVIPTPPKPKILPIALSVLGGAGILYALYKPAGQKIAQNLAANPALRRPVKIRQEK